MLVIDSKGVTVPDLEQVVDELVSGYRLIYGTDINVSSSTPDGQRIGIEAQAIKDTYDTLAYAIQMSDPLYAIGKWADVIAALSGIRRAIGKYTILPDVKIITDRNLTLKKGYAVTDTNGNKWLIESDVILITGSNLVNFRSEFYGAVSANVGDILEPIEIILGVKFIELTKNPIEGSLGESTAAMMNRRLRRVAKNNSHDREGIEASLLGLDGVLDAVVLENNSITPSDINGVPIHFINAIVLGGDNKDIALTIQHKIQGGGCGTFGSILETLTDYRGNDRLIRFDRPIVKEVSAEVVVVRAKAQTDIDTDYIKDSISDKTFIIGQSVVSGMLYCFTSDGSFYIKSIKIDGSDLVEVSAREVAVIPKNNVSVVIE